jgi:hypothetical protein
MTGAHGQASAEYAGLLALAALLGAGLALIAGPPLLGAIRDALVAVLSGESRTPASERASAADIADVQSALVPGADALTPDAALLALGRRHGSAGADEIADALLLDAARIAAPWLGRPRIYRAWTQLAGAPYAPAPRRTRDHDVETPTGQPVVTWISVSAQRRAVATALAHHTSATALGLEIVSIIPGAQLARGAAAVGARRVGQAVLEHLPEAVHAARTGSDVVDLVSGDGSDVPAGLRAGDVVVEWTVHRTPWRDGQPDDRPRVAVGRGIDLLPPAQDYEHVVYLRPHPGGLEIVAEQLAR